MKILLILISLLIIAPIRATDRIYSQSSTLVRHTGHQGELALWLNLGELKLSEEISPLPLRGCFYSKDELFADSCMGAGWWFPFLESYYKLENEKKCVIYTIGGDAIYLFGKNVQFRDSTGGMGSDNNSEEKHPPLT